VRTLVVDGATMRCDAGAAPATLAVPRRVANTGPPVAAVIDHTPTSIPSFGMCQSMANPQVAAATAAAGTLTPQPCTPVVPAPWSPGTSQVTTDPARLRALSSDSTCQCAYGGSIKIVKSGTSVRVD
jgi:hypothetical protein